MSANFVRVGYLLSGDADPGPLASIGRAAAVLCELAAFVHADPAVPMGERFMRLRRLSDLLVPSVHAAPAVWDAALALRLECSRYGAAFSESRARAAASLLLSSLGVWGLRGGVVSLGLVHDRDLGWLSWDGRVWLPVGVSDVG